MADKERAKFASKLGVILATAGSAVGLGNVWRFPYMTGQNGGAVFILIYIVCVPCQHGSGLSQDSRPQRLVADWLHECTHGLSHHGLLCRCFRLVPAVLVGFADWTSARRPRIFQDLL